MRRRHKVGRKSKPFVSRLVYVASSRVTNSVKDKLKRISRRRGQTISEYLRERLLNRI